MTRQNEITWTDDAPAIEWPKDLVSAVGHLLTLFAEIDAITVDIGGVPAFRIDRTGEDKKDEPVKETETVNYVPGGYL
jgi:hypothetical protein